ncbi:response regulator transcription factor [Mechercharimyces sp. CAU 1602]|uniref:response regulator transcription factor n=1 Tax=Mechercharimyces sp. CAU 1602 TaxID=2973933 RepID=UPI002163DE88|nr:response regulator transcription factor [Mechercharimyces sp. CAU 1602]MCS1352075.1 response regulator transcription factor [Mechercharimyces sp. CAU 1602]
MKRVLLAEDEVTIARVLEVYLQKAGFIVSVAHDGREAISKFGEEEPDLVILDVMMPEQNGWEVLQTIRQRSSCPVMMLTALGDVEYRLQGLNHGADDYVSKPFEAEEVVARAQAILRRSQKLLQNEDGIQYGSLNINFTSDQVTVDGDSIALTPRDRSLLLFLARHPNQTFSRMQLLDRIWGMDYEGSDRAVDLSIKRIRKSLCQWPSTEGEILTRRGVGYQLRIYEK